MVRAYLLNRKELENIKFDPAILSEGRREKLEKIKHEDDKELGTCVELLLIHALKDLDPEISLPLQITEEEGGNLLLDSKVNGFEKLYFNMSHSKDYALCAVCDKPIGVDIECIKTKDVSHMDKILVLNEGNVEAFDTPENLLKISPTYQKMVFLQKLESEL